MRARLRAASDELNEVLIDAGFSRSFGGSWREPSGVTYCTPFDDFAARYPTMPPARVYQRGTGACVDLVMQVDAEDRMTELHLEGFDLHAVVRAAGYSHEAKTVEGLIGSDVLDAIATLRPILTSLFAPKSN